MIFLFSLTVAVLFGAGAFLMLKRDLIRVVGGVILLSNAVNLFIMSAGLTRGRAPIYPFPQGTALSDPLVQALTLTAIVISFGLSALLLTLVYRVATGYEVVQTGDDEPLLAAAQDEAANAGAPEPDRERGVA